MNWRNSFYHTVRNHLMKHVHPNYLPIFLSWWEGESRIIMNEFGELMDRNNDEGREEALEELQIAIEADANINKDDANVQRVLYLIKVLGKEAQQEVDYTNPVDQDGDEDSEASNRIKTALDQ